ncbi:predicted protein, partial [Thalassiosira pseudonana CCMP1335]
ILLHGPPGCGKTKLAKAVAGEAQAAYLSVGPSDILSKYVGESEASVRGLFLEGDKCAVIFFDEIDALGRSRVDEDVQTPTRSSSSAGKQGNAVKPRQPKPRVIVVAATNRPEDCDPALLRRFACRVLVGLPSRKDRKKIIKRLLSDVKNDLTPSQLDELALATEGWSGSDLESMTREAVMAPVRETLCAAAIQKRKASKAVKRSGAGS